MVVDLSVTAFTKVPRFNLMWNFGWRILIRLNLILKIVLCVGQNSFDIFLIFKISWLLNNSLWFELRSWFDLLPRFRVFRPNILCVRIYNIDVIGVLVYWNLCIVFFVSVLVPILTLLVHHKFRICVKLLWVEHHPWVVILITTDLLRSQVSLLFFIHLTHFYPGV